jgi:hypothetical protein
MKVYKCLGGNCIFYSRTPKGRILAEIEVDEELLSEDLEASVLAQEHKDDLEAIGIYL